MAWSMTSLAPRSVNPGFFRSTLLIVLGLCVLALLAGWEESNPWTLALVLAGALGCYVGSVLWQLERVDLGRAFLLALSAIFAAAVLTSPSTTSFAWSAANGLAGAALLGSALAAMLLGHYYLTAPWMSLDPLRRSVLAISMSAVLRGCVLAGLLYEAPWGSLAESIGVAELGLYFALRVILGVVGPLALSVFAWRTIDLKHTQAATGILYVVVILTLFGEVTGIAVGRVAGVPL